MLGSRPAPYRVTPRPRAAALRTPLAPPDTILFAVVATLVAIGLVMIYSASSATAIAEKNDAAYYVKHQFAWLAVGSIAAFGAYRLDYHRLKPFATWGVLFSFVTLLAVLIPHVGYLVGGARRWLGAGALQFQPSEVAKLTLVVFVAAKLASVGENVRSITRGVAPVLIVGGALAGLVLREPDMGTASLLMFTALAMLFTAGARLTHLFLALAVALPTAAASVLASPYKRDRIFAFINPWRDQYNTGFHIVQSLLALGSGGIFGLGLGASRQKFFYLPEQYTDFIFAIIGEELGIVGALAVIVLFVVFAFRAVRIAIAAPDRFGMLLALGCTFLIVIQAFINIGVVTSSWPVTGVPLPFLSFGGTSLVVSLVAVALIINVGRHRKARPA